MMATLLNWLFCLLATEALTELLVDAKITTGLRAWLFHKGTIDPEHDNPNNLTWQQHFWIFWNTVITCGYCTSVWVAMLIFYGTPKILEQPGIINSIVNWLLVVLVLHRGSNWLHVLYSIVKKGRVRYYDVEYRRKVGGDTNGSS